MAKFLSPMLAMAFVGGTHMALRNVYKLPQHGSIQVLGLGPPSSHMVNDNGVTRGLAEKRVVINGETIM